MGRRLHGVAALVGAAMLVAGCSADQSAPPQQPAVEANVTTSETSESVSSPTATTAATSTSSAASPSPAQVPPATSAVVAPPTLVECIYGGGAWTTQGWMSDGTYQEHPTCAARRAEQLAKYPHRCPRTDHYVADLSECAWNEVSTATSETPQPGVPSDADAAPVPQPVETPIADVELDPNSELARG